MTDQQHRARPQRRRPDLAPTTRRPTPVSGPLGHAIEVGRTRLLITGAVLTMAFATIAARMVDVAVVHSDAVLANGDSGHTEQATSARADILDRNGVIVATSLRTASLYADPIMVLDPQDAAYRLATVLPSLDPAQTAERLSGKGRFVWLKRNLTPRQQLAVNRLGIPGLDFREEETRVYPHGPLLSHIVGFVDIDNRGISGIEKTFEERLHLEDAPVTLSVDIRVQHILRDELSKAMERFRAVGAAGTILDVRTGEIVAMVSLPDFDPNHPGAAADDERFNRNSLGQYEMGSVFKVFTTAMALDSGVVRVDGGYDASQPIHVSRFTIRDYHAKNRWLSVPEIFMYSSNIGSAKMALDVGGPAQRAFLQRLGMLDPVAVELPEVGAPMVPAQWRPINTMTIAFGHGIAVSPLHTVSGVAAMVGDGIVRRPTLMKHNPSDEIAGRRVISEATVRQMRKLMRLVVEQGTAKAAAAPGYVVGGKTGTAEKQSSGGYDRDALISSFVGAFPMQDPRYVVFALLDEPKGDKGTHGYATGGWVAAPVIKDVVERAAPLLGVQPTDETAPDLRKYLAIDLGAEEKRLAAY